MDAYISIIENGAMVDALLTRVSESDIIGNKVTRSATLVVAASNSSAKSKSQADYVCDGIEDNVEIQEALNSLPATGGEVKLLEGQFNLATTISRAIDNIVISGSGHSTYLTNNGVTKLISIGSQKGWTLKDMRMDAGGFDTIDGKKWLVSNIERRYMYSDDFILIDKWSSDAISESTVNDRHSITTKNKLVKHIDNFESGWNATSGTVTVDTTIFHTKNKSTKLVTALGITSNLEKNISLDMTHSGLAFWMYTPDNTKISKLQVWIQTDGGWSANYGQDANNYAQIPNVNGKWTLFVVPYFKEYGTPNFANTTRIRIAVEPKTGESAIVYFNDLMTWKNKLLLPNGAVTFVCDDGLPSIHDLGKPKLDEYGYAGVWAIVIGRLDQTTVSSSYHMQNNGWDIINHSVDHTESRMLTDSRFQYSIAQKWLLGNGFKSGANFASICFGMHDNTLTDFVDNHMIWATSTMQGMNALPVVPSRIIRKEALLL